MSTGHALLGNGINEMSAGLHRIESDNGRRVGIDNTKLTIQFAKLL